jgi:hypothetical protein
MIGTSFDFSQKLSKPIKITPNLPPTTFTKTKKTVEYQPMSCATFMFLLTIAVTNSPVINDNFV